MYLNWKEIIITQRSQQHVHRDRRGSRTLHTGKLEVTTKLSRLFNFRIGIGIGIWGLSFVLMPIAHVKLNNNYQLSTFVCVSGLSGSIEELSRQRVLLCRFYLPLQMIIYYQCPLWLWLPCVRVTPARFCTVATFSSDFPIGRPGLVGGLTMRLQSGGNYWDWSGRADWLLIYHPCSQGRSSCRGQEG